MRVVTVVGTRPQLIKAAALQPAIRERHEELLVDTGQHWDDNLSGMFFRQLGLARPDFTLNAGGGSQAQQTATILAGLEPILVAQRPDAVLVYGDTNSTLGGALAAAKLGIPVAHVEAGLRSFDRHMPEEINRIVADHVSRWLFAPTPTAVANLANEGIRDGVLLVGDLMQDLAARTLPRVRDAAVLDEVARSSGLAASRVRLEPGGYLYATIHRQENRLPDAVTAWATLLRRVAMADRPVVLALHPGTRASLEQTGANFGAAVHVIEPVGYRDSLALQLHAAAVLTDSGGVQREAAWLTTPCLVLRRSTEWTEALATSSGRMVLVGLDATAAAAALEALAPINSGAPAARTRAASTQIPEVGAAAGIAEALKT
jgi:UDP-GlcNAc3NAcA epimerase